MKTAGEGGGSAEAQKSVILYCFTVFKENIMLFECSSSPDFEVVVGVNHKERAFSKGERPQRRNS